MKAADLVRKHGISMHTFYRWKAKYSGTEVSDAKRLKQLEDENRRLKQAVADLTLDNQALNALWENAGEDQRPTRGGRVRHGRLRDQPATILCPHWPRPCQLPLRGKRKPDEELRQRLIEMAAKKSRWGYRTLLDIVRRDRVVNHIKLHRLYKLEKLQVRLRRRRKRVVEQRVPMAVPDRSNQRWSMDFTRDTLAGGRPFRTLNIVDDYTRECPAIEVDHSLPGLRVVRVLEQLAETRGLPETIVGDNGREFAGRVLDRWAFRRGVYLHFIDPGRPVQNRSSRASMAGSETSASTSTGSRACRTHGRRSRSIGRNTTRTGHTARSGPDARGVRATLYSPPGAFRAAERKLQPARGTLVMPGGVNGGRSEALAAGAVGHNVGLEASEVDGSLNAKIRTSDLSRRPGPIAADDEMSSLDASPHPCS